MIPVHVQKGFSLLELMVVLVIIGLLATLVGPTLISKLGDSQQKVAKSQISMLESALDSYRMDVGVYPRELKALRENIENKSMWNGPYLKKDLPQDPWGNDYLYQSPGKEGKDYDLISLGADSQEGGDGEKADVTN